MMASGSDVVYKCLLKTLSHEELAKFQQVLEYISERLYAPLYKSYDAKLMEQINEVCTYEFPDNYSSSDYVSSKMKFYAFKFISNVGRILIRQYRDGILKAEEKLISLFKILLHHGLTSKSDTANLALVELEQLCLSFDLTLPSLYHRYRPKTLRVILKAILHKLTTTNGSSSSSAQVNGNNISNGSLESAFSSGSGDGSTTSGEGQRLPQRQVNCVIVYMTRAFQIFNISSISSRDIEQSLIIITNLILKDKYNEAIRCFLEQLAKSQNIDIYTLIKAHIPAVLVSLLLTRKLSDLDTSASLDRLCSFCDKTPRQMLLHKFSTIKANLLLHYSADAKVVSSALFYLSKIEEENLDEQPLEEIFEDESCLIDHLYPSMVGILLGIDNYLDTHSQELVSDEGIGFIKSVAKLVSLLNVKQVETIHHKLLSTLSLVIRIRPTRDNILLNEAIADLWSVFLKKLSDKLKNSLVINLCAALYDLLEDHPESVSELYSSLISGTKTSEGVEKLKCLFFIPDAPGLQKVYELLNQHVMRGTTVSNLRGLEKHLEGPLLLMTFENQKLNLLAVKRIRELLKANQSLIVNDMLLNLDQSLDCSITKTIETLLSLSSTQDAQCLTYIAECLGILGAVNPIRSDHLIYGQISNVGSSITRLDCDAFIIELIERLKNILFSDRRSESEVANYVLQVVVKNYDVFNTNLRKNLSDEALRACELCKDTSYLGARRATTNLSTPVYDKLKNANQHSYKEWLDRFTLVLISFLSDTKIELVLDACIYIFKHNLKLADWIVPVLVTHIFIHHPDKLKVVGQEINAIISEDINNSSQDPSFSVETSYSSNSQALDVQCANMIFCILDALNHLAKELARSVVKEDRLKTTQKVSMRGHLMRLKEFMSTIPKDKLALLAGKCRAYTRALYYFDQHIFGEKWTSNVDTHGIIEQYWTPLQKVYIALDDIYQAAGVDLVRKSLTNISDDLANYESLCRFDKAFMSYNVLLETANNTVDKRTLIEDSLKCLSNQGDHHRLYEKSTQLMSEYPQFKQDILPAAIEACWKLGKWDELDKTFKNISCDSMLAFEPVSKGYLLNSLCDSMHDTKNRLDLVKNRLMRPLGLAMMDRSAYFRGYQNLLVLHSIEDFSLALDVLTNKEFETQQLDENTCDSLRGKLVEKLDSLFSTWNQRNKLVQPSLRSREPLLAWQRSISCVLSKRYPFIQDKIHMDVGSMWLTSANSARDARCFDRSFYCLTQSRRWFDSQFDKLSIDLRVKFAIGHAKLDWDQGEQTKAIRDLKLVRERLGVLELHQHLEKRKVISDAQKLSKQHQSVSPFPNLQDTEACDECSRFPESTRRAFAEVEILLTRYTEEADAAAPETVFFMYDQCVHLGVNQEEIYVCLARYYDKLASYYAENPQMLTDFSKQSSRQDRRASKQFDSSKARRTSDSFRSSEDSQESEVDDTCTMLMAQSIEAFSHSLRWGMHFLEESMPRMLNLWFDLGSKKLHTKHADKPRSISSRIEKTIRLIGSMLKSPDIPSYYFIPALSLILSRVCHPHSGIAQKATEILIELLHDYPYQMTWLMIAMTNDENIDRKRTAERIFRGAKVKAKSPEDQKNLLQIFSDTIKFSKMLCRLSVALPASDTTGKRKKLNETENPQISMLDPTILKHDLSKFKTIVPVQTSIQALLPTESDSNNLKQYNVFPDQYKTFLREFKKDIRVFNSLQAPRAIGLRGTNGKSYELLCKHGDDLRKDRRCIEFFNLLNRVLRKNNQSSARFFEIATFLVLPLETQVGIIEMVPNCETLRSAIESQYKQRHGRQFDFTKLLTKRNNRRQQDAITDAELYKEYVEIVMPKMRPPVMPDFFLQRFIDPTSWYMARLTYARTTAVMSVGGYIIGLGDRHLDNILIDTNNGRIIHVDFNLLFDAASNLPVPETVPFRLTPNVVAGFGPMGTEGNFRKICEIAMQAMRNEKELLLTTLKPFVHDPCSEHVRDRSGGNMKIDHEENIEARAKILAIERKLKGFPLSNSSKPLAIVNSYSVEAQVESLIDHASDQFNLSQMYFGWCPHV